MLDIDLQRNVAGLFEGFKDMFESELNPDSLNNIFNERLSEKQKEYILGRIESWSIDDLIKAKKLAQSPRKSTKRRAK